MEVLYDRALHATSDKLLPQPAPGDANEGGSELNAPPPVTEQAALTLALIDSLCFLHVDELEDWLPLTAQLLTAIRAPDMHKLCVERFWGALSNGEMDVERAHFCVTWWSTRGGREMVLYGAADLSDSVTAAIVEGEAGAGAEAEGAFMMSGALGSVARESKL